MVETGRSKQKGPPLYRIPLGEPSRLEPLNCAAMESIDYEAIELRVLAFLLAEEKGDG